MFLRMADFHRTVTKLKHKIFLSVGRGIVSAINNSGKTQRCQLQALANEILAGVDRYQEYGLETFPKTDAEFLAVFPGGNRDQGVIVCVHDRRYRPTNLASGEVMVYTLENVGGDHRIHLKSGKAVEVVGTVVKLGASSGHKAVCVEDLIDAFNNHTHPETGATTGTPTVPLVKADYVTQETKAT
jgi:phage baseplate assembly protein V